MTKTAIFYHAGCPVCVAAENVILDVIKPSIELDIIHLGNHPELIEKAKESGVKSVPALVIDGVPLHINFGASLDDLK